MGLLDKSMRMREATFLEYRGEENGLLRRAMMLNLSARRGGTGILAYIEKKKY
jgi:hypothetical protein